MTIRVALHHRTLYKFDRSVGLSPHEIRLRPAPHCRTPIVSYSLRVAPEKHFVNWQQDAYGNYIARFVFPEPARALDITVDLVADMTVINPFDFFIEHYAEHFPFDYPPQLAVELAPYLERETPGPLLGRWLAEFRERGPKPGGNTADFLVDLNQRIAGQVKYLVRMEPGIQSPDQTLELCAGSCRDSGWLLVQILRHLGLAARFVSGYLVQLVADVKPLDGPAGPAGRLHRSPRLGRGLPSRRGLDRPRSHVRNARRRRPHPARRHGVPVERRAGHRFHRRLQFRARLRDEGDPHPRGSARHQAVLGCAVGGDRRPRTRRRPGPRGRAAPG